MPICSPNLIATLKLTVNHDLRRRTRACVLGFDCRPSFRVPRVAASIAKAIDCFNPRLCCSTPLALWTKTCACRLALNPNFLAVQACALPLISIQVVFSERVLRVSFCSDCSNINSHLFWGGLTLSCEVGGFPNQHDPTVVRS